MQSHIHTLVKHLFDKDSFDQVTVQELKQFTEAYPYAAAGHFLYAKKLYDARSWNYYEQTEQASLYFHNPLWYSWLMEQKYEEPIAAPVQSKQEEPSQQQSAYRVVVQMPKGVAPVTSPPESEKEFSSLHEFETKPDAEPIQASTEAFGDIVPEEVAADYTEAVTDNTGEQPQPLNVSNIETVADIPAAKEEIESTPEFFAEAAQEKQVEEEAPGDLHEAFANTVAIAENFSSEEAQLAGNGELSQTFETPGSTENSEWDQGTTTPIQFEGPVATEPKDEHEIANTEWNEFVVSPETTVEEPSGNEEPPVHIEGDILSFAEAVLGTAQQENIPVELMAETPDADHIHAASDLTPYHIVEQTGETEATTPLYEDLTTEHTIDEPEAQAKKQPVTEEQPETVTETDPQPVTEEQPEQLVEQPAESTTEQEPETAAEPQHITEEQPAEPQPEEQPVDTPAEHQPEPEQLIIEEPTSPAADLQPELQAQPEPVAELQEPQAEAGNNEVTLPGLNDLPPVSVFTQANTEPKTAIDTEEPIFESYHTIDYFASQGIKLQQEDFKDRLGKQLKTFSEWLRSMKRIVPTDATTNLDEVTNKSIQRIAEHSVEEKEIITEAMAEVWAKQGHNDKAISVYEKLSLQNPAKSPYFAGRIEQLKAL